LASLVGGVILLWKEEWAKRISLSLVSFAAGALIGAAFLDLLPEAVALGATTPFVFVIGGFLLFFILEKLLIWHHHHVGKHGRGEFDEHENASLILIGDTVHNVADGIIIAGSFLNNISLGIATSVAVLIHEIPQEIGDFGVLLHSGMARGRILFLNVAVALSTVVAALFSYFYLVNLENVGAVLLPAAAGIFIYIAAADLIPQTHKEEKWYKAVIQVALLVLGIALVWSIGEVFPG
jgi:zinc and cadmium transporter